MNTKLKKYYEKNLFEDREYCCDLVLFLKKIDINITTDDFNDPKTMSDYIFWIENKVVRKSCIQEALLKSNTIALEYLYTIQDQITEWAPVLKHNPFGFLSIDNIKRSLEEGYAQDWISIFKNINTYKINNEHTQNIWKQLYKHVLSITTLNTYNHPNVNDGKWIKKDNIPKNTWVLVNETVTNSYD